MPPNQPNDKHTGNVVLEKPKRPTAKPTLVDVKFADYGGTPEHVDNWQAIALAALDIFTELGVGYLLSQGIERRSSIWKSTK